MKKILFLLLLVETLTAGYRPLFCLSNICMGADAGIAALVSPANNYSPGLLPVNVTLKNFGSTVLTSVTINWAVDNNSQVAYSWTGSLNQNGTGTANIGSYNFASGIHHVKAWTSNPNGISDSNPLNDTLFQTIFACNGGLNGVYSIGGNQADFQSINGAVAALNSCGLAGPVIFNLDTGTFLEQVNLITVSGASLSNTITFQSACGDSSKVRIFYPHPNTLVKMDSASHYIFNKLSFVSDSANNLVLMERSSSFNTFTHCQFIHPVSNIGWSLVISSPFSGSCNKFNVITDNLFNNGSCGINGTGDGETRLDSGLVIRNNIFNQQIALVIQVNNVYNCTIEKNRIFSNINYEPNSLNFGLIGIDGAGANLKIDKNTIILPTGGFRIGIRLNQMGSAILSNIPAKVSNNVISLSTKDGDPSYGIYQVSCNANCYNNSILITGLSTITFQNNSCYYSTGIDTLTNNILYNSSNGYAIWLPYNAWQNYTGRNNLFRVNLNPTLGISGTSYQTLAAWSYNNNELNTIGVNPQFLSSTDLHIITPTVYQKGIPVAGILDDRDDSLRNPIKPCIGAYEYRPTQGTITTVTNSTCSNTCTGQAITHPFGSGPFTYSWSPSGGNQDTATGLCPGTYIVSVTANTWSATDTITISSPAALSLNHSITNLSCDTSLQPCNGRINLTVSGGTVPYTYSWQPSITNGPLTPSTLCPGNYTCTVTDSNGCSLPSQVFSITAPAPIHFTVTSTPASCASCADGTETISGVGGGVPPYSYSFPGACNYNPCHLVAPGVQACCVTDAHGCQVCKNDTMKFILGIENLIKSDGFAVFPNPFEDHIEISSTSPVQRSEVMIQNLLGEIVIREFIGPGSSRLQTTDLPQGVYLITVRNDRTSYTWKLIKNH